MLVTAFAQKELDETTYYNLFDQAVGKENTALYRGKGYVAKYRVINEYHNFFETSEFLLGSITYDGARYSGLRLKYNIYEDEVVLTLNRGSGVVYLQPYKHLVTGFHIENHKFRRMTDTVALENGFSGFYEVLLENAHFTFFKKNRKQKFKKTRKKLVFYEFKSKHSYVLRYKGEYHKIRSSKDFSRIFPDLKSDIKALSKGSKKKRNSEESMIALLKLVASLSAQNNTP